MIRPFGSFGQAQLVTPGPLMVSERQTSGNQSGTGLGALSGILCMMPSGLAERVARQEQEKKSAEKTTQRIRLAEIGTGQFVSISGQATYGLHVAIYRSVHMSPPSSCLS